jgi:hypothetical protein
MEDFVVVCFIFIVVADRVVQKVQSSYQAEMTKLAKTQPPPDAAI